MTGRISSLDGLRAIAIVCVIVGNLEHTRGFPPITLSRYVGDYGTLGVTLFFVISGFLITSLLMKEHARNGAISLRSFYLCRALRVVPPLLLFVCGLVAADALGWTHITGTDVLVALTYTANYDVHRNWNIGHLWVPSVEEQFYLLWPLALFFLGPGKRAFIIALGMFLVAPVVRTGMHAAFHGPVRDLEIFPAVCDSIAIGCLLALCRERLLKNPSYLRLTEGAAVWPLVPLVLLINRFDGDYTLAGLFGTPVKLIALAVLIERCTRETSVVGKILSSRPFVAVGVLSYSLYLWQQPFMIDSPAIVTRFPFNVCVVFALATGSYLLLSSLRRLRAPRGY